MVRSVPLERYRNIGIMAHIDAGKATTTERILQCTNPSLKIAAVYSPEPANWNVPKLPATTCRWRDHRINIIEMPGHVDFTIEVDRSLHVLDGAVAVFDSVAGVEPQSEVMWRMADKYGVPRICFVNKMDRTGADFYRCVQMIKDRLGAEPLVAQLPLGDGSKFIGLVDLVAMKSVTCSDDSPVPEIGDIPADMKEQAEELHGELIEACVELDESVMEAYLEGKQPDAETLKKLIRKGTISGAFVPVLCGSAFKNKGVQPMLDAVVEFLPSPLDVPAVQGTEVDGDEEMTRKADDNEPFSGLAFKIMTDAFVGSLTFVRIYSGVLASGAHVLASAKGEKIQIGRILQMHANHREDIKEACAGDIVALAGLRGTVTGDTLCDPAHPIALERMEFPEPVIEVAIEPKSKADQERMDAALSCLALEDPSFRPIPDPESGQTIIKGMGELHLEIIVDRLKREFMVEANVGAPQVAYRESITKKIEGEYTYHKHTGPAFPYAKVKIRFEPGEPSSGFVFENAASGHSVPEEYVVGVKKGLERAKETGVIAGFPVMDLKCTLIDGGYHDVDSNVMTFDIAARACFREAIPKAGPRVLEPMMRVEVVTPQEYMGDVIGDLNSRRGQVQGMDSRGNAQVITAMVPLANMFGYVSTLRSMTQGRAQYSMHFDHYEQVPPPYDGDGDFPMAAALRR